MQVQDYGPTGRALFGGGASETVMHPVVIVAVIVAIILILVAPRKYALAAFLIINFVSPFGQQWNVGGMHFFVLRIVVLAGWARLAYTKLTSQTEIVSGGINVIDKLFFLWAFFRTAATLILYASVPALINQGGFLLDVIGAYYFLRFLIRDQEDVIRAIKITACLMLGIGISMLYESLHSQNIFGYLGSVPIVPTIRQGAVRAQGPFGHPILGGVFAATVLPLFVLLWKSEKSKLVSIAGIIGSTATVVGSASSTPLLAYLAVVLGICMWPLRKSMRLLRWGFVILLVALQMVMKAPVWFIIDHVDLIAGNSGFHRASLIDGFFRHFFDWWLIGTKAASTWGYDMWDLAIEFVAQGEVGGLATFVCFVAMVSIGFSWIGKARKAVEGDRKQEWIVWLLGVTLFSHVVAFFGISYWDQTRVSWYALFAMISAICVPILKSQVVPQQAELALPNSRLAYGPSSALASTRRRLTN